MQPHGLSSASSGPGEGGDTVHRAFLSQHGPVSDDEFRQALQTERTLHADEALSLYVHLPFCPSRCLTCDHHSMVTHDLREIDRYLDAIEREVELFTDSLGRGRKLRQLHLGGGTPNYLSEIQLVRLIDILDRHFTMDEDTDASIEANAHRASHSQLGLLHGLGFRGLNLEVRDLDPEVLQAVGRAQSPAVLGDVVDIARQLGFDRVSTDLVYGLPRQTAQSIQRTLQQLLALDPDRISCVAHSRRQQVFEHQRAVDATQLPSLADKVAMFSRIVDTLCGSGDYEWVGLDCFARASDPITLAQQRGELHRNWIGYSDRAARRLIGLGNSSVSDLTEICVRSHPSVDYWRQSVERGEFAVHEGEHLDSAHRARRNALSDLMCNLQSTSVAELMEGEDSSLKPLVEDGLLEIDSERVAVTEAGRFVLHRIWGDSAPAHRWGHLA